MSKKFLEQILKEELRVLEEDSEFVRDTSDSKIHKFSVSVIGISNEINRQLMSFGYASPETIQSPEVQQVVKDGAENLAKTAHKNIVTYSSTKGNVEVRGNSKSFSVLTATTTAGFSFKSKSYVSELNVFETIKKSYSQPRNTLVDKLNKVIQQKEAGAKKIRANYFLDLDHRGGSVVSRQEVTQSKSRLSSKITTRNEGASRDKITSQDLEDLGITLEVSKKDTEGRTVIGVGLRAAKLNRGKDSTKQKAAKQRYVKKLEEAVIRLNTSEAWAKRKGSDSRLTIERKKVIATFDRAVKDKASKNLKQTTKDYKPKYSNSKVSKKVSKKPSAGKQSKVPVGKLPLQKARPEHSSTESVITLAALINQKLPATVAKNMGLPALRYRTGRFASSVHVTDVVRTTKGFPSIGYTYQKYPYQTFEPGYEQGTIDRDPRRLIDKSIREIAAGLLVGRFYTRRV